MVDRTEYDAAAHAMQTGVMMEMEINPKATTPKHLRVGINAAMSDHGALVNLLIKKGLITEEEYVAEITQFMKREKQRYEDLLREHFGRAITLG